MSEIRLEGQEPEEIQEPSAFEVQLMEALRRVEAPEGFAARVVERAEGAEIVVSHFSGVRHGAPGVFGGPGAKVVEMQRRHARMWVGGAIAAMLAVGAFVGEAVHVRHEREQAELATQQFEAAMRVTDQALDKTRAQLERAGLKLDE